VPIKMTFHIIYKHIQRCHLKTHQPIQLPFAPSIHYSVNIVYNNSQVNLIRLSQYLQKYLEKKLFSLIFFSRTSVRRCQEEICESIWLNFTQCLLHNVRMMQNPPTNDETSLTKSYLWICANKTIFSLFRHCFGAVTWI